MVSDLVELETSAKETLANSKLTLSQKLYLSAVSVVNEENICQSPTASSEHITEMGAAPTSYFPFYSWMNHPAASLPCSANNLQSFADLLDKDKVRIRRR